MTLAGPKSAKKKKPAAARNTAPQGHRKRAATPRASAHAGTGADPATLLAWYDRHRRVLPWRARVGEPADPYRVWLSEIMLQQTTVRAVAPYYARFLDRFPTVEQLAAAPLREVLSLWAGLGYYARARNLHACAQVVVECHGGRFPASEQELRRLPGVGTYTAAAIAAIAFDLKATPVDGNVERVVARLNAVADPLPGAKPALRAMAAALTPERRAGDFAQAMMDLGATLCTPKNPACVLCPWSDPCAARRSGDAEAFPAKAEKRAGRLRHGAAFVALREDGSVLVQTRNDSGLLGGMTEVPGTGWAVDFMPTAPDGAPRFEKPDGSARRLRWRRVPGVVSHAFTHFPLELVVFVAQVPEGLVAPWGTRWVAREKLGNEALPTVMRKVLAHAGVEMRPSRRALEP